LTISASVNSFFFSIALQSSAMLNKGFFFMDTYTITDIKSREIIDNRGMPTIRVYVCVGSEHWGSADVPCGSSTGSYEAVEVRDGEARFRGKGVRKAIQNIHQIIAPKLTGAEATRQQEIDDVLIDLDGTPNKSKLGGNAILGVSLAVARAAAKVSRKPLYQYINRDARVLPVPQACLINGGLHAGNDLDIQEFCLMPSGAETFAEAVQILCETFMNLKDILQKKIGKEATNSSEDGGFAPPISSTRQALDYLHEAAERSGFANRVAYALDFAATGFYNAQKQTYSFEGAEKNRAAMIDFICRLIDEYPLIAAIEDPLDENDLQGMSALTAKLRNTLIIGDDMFATNIHRIQQGISQKAANAILCKVNQIGTLSEAAAAVRFARQHHYAVVMSERSGETEDDILSDISVAFNAGLFKTGGIRGSDRGSKYNRFMEIEEALGTAAIYAGNRYRETIIA
jgi:enolase